MSPLSIVSGSATGASEANSFTRSLSHTPDNVSITRLCMLDKTLQVGQDFISKTTLCKYVGLDFVNRTTLCMQD